MPKEFARRLLEFEAATGGSSSSDIAAAFAVCDKLSGPLSKLMGVAGYSTLLRRASVLAGAEIPWLRALKISSNGSLAGMAEQNTMPSDPAEVMEGEVVLIGHLLGLLVILIGPALTLQLLHDVWPDWTITPFEEKEAL
jgi:hypothetical protein